jgi:TonB family protein
MEVSRVSAVLGNSPAEERAFADARGYALRVQSAVGPKHLNGNGLQGRVMVAFSLSADGSLMGVRVTQSSGEQTLDSRALQIVGKASFPTPPTGLKVAGRSYVSVFTFE